MSKTGLYDPAFEHDGCGVAMVARPDGVPTHEVVVRGLKSLCNLEHRGAEGADAATGDGAGILLQMPDKFLRAVVDFDLPPPERYAVAVCFLPQNKTRAQELEALFVERAKRRGMEYVGARDVPARTETIGRVAREAAPIVRHLFFAAAADWDSERFERELYIARRMTEVASGEELTVPSCSSRTLTYKGMLSAPQLGPYFPDLLDARIESALALVHSRFSTNTFPNWRLAHPFRMLAHNGEVNTVIGNGNWMRARQSELESELFGDALEEMFPIIRPGGSDSACLDNVLELLVRGGRSLPHAVMMLVPKAWQGNRDMPEQLAGFYRYHSCLMEPWDGPACVTFTDGRIIGATLDRNGLRPGRWAVTNDGWVVLASEAGTLPLDESTIVRKGRLQPGRLFVVDLERHQVFSDGEVELEVARHRPYGQWYAEQTVQVEDLPKPTPPERSPLPLRVRQLAFGWSQEDIRFLTAPLVRAGKEANGSMGNDIPLAVLSQKAPSLFGYFKQRFAQVTNPAIDPVREAVVMSLAVMFGPERNLLDETPEHCKKIVLKQPILREKALSRIRQADAVGLRTVTLDATFPVSDGPGGLEPALDALCVAADRAIDEKAALLIISDRKMAPDRAPIPSLLALGAVHHHLVRTGRRLRVGIIVESGEAREVHHMALLVGYGASAVCPYMMFESIPALIASGDLPKDTDVIGAQKAIMKGLGQGLLKILSKMGISTMQSYMGAQVFEAIGLDDALIQKYFTGTPSRIRGVGLDVIAKEALERHRRGFPAEEDSLLPTGGIYAWRRFGEHHMWNPETVPALQEAVRATGDARRAYQRFADLVNNDAAKRATLRGLLRFVEAPTPVPLEEVEPAKEIVKRFATGAMSLGSISPESHSMLAVAMNRLGGKSNTGEGGEDPARFGDERRSAIKQVASGRFGVTVHYLVNADQLQIKVAQGAKPGEGGQLPGHKVSELIAELRYSTPGVELISPPPHHDIYSIEDLKQLIYDLRCSNPTASVSVKLVAEAGVGTVAAGVAKANADHIVIAGHEGGTGSSPLSSIQHAGSPWELGLAETQQTLVLHDLRSRVTLQVDGHMKTGRDVVVAGILGAEEMGFSTAPLIALGCIMMRVCHLNTCPVGIATQDPELRRRFAGTPEHVMNYFFMVAEEAREIMAKLGVRRFADLIGRTELLEADTAIDHYKARRIDLSAILAPPGAPNPRCKIRDPDPVLGDALDHELIRGAHAALDMRKPVEITASVVNKHRAVGALLSSEIARRYGRDGLPASTIVVRLTGSAGQSFGAWLAHGVDLFLEGEANDYVGKGLSGGVIAVRPPKEAPYIAESNVIIGNTVLYGATSGRAFFRGKAGERFAVRNSGAMTVVEGVGDHGCEYMTGGVVVVLGKTGFNFAAGMSGGVAYVYDPGGHFATRLNYELIDLDPFDENDWQLLKALLTEHVERTDSALGQRILDEWSVASRAFVKVMPRAYKQALIDRHIKGGVETAAPEEVSASA